MSSETERKTYQEMEKARLFDRVIGSASKINERYEAIWSHVKPHWSQAKLIVDIGTGPARLLGFLAERLPETQFIGLDIAPPMLMIAQENLQRLNLLSRVKLICQDCTQLPFEDGSVSGVLSTGTYRGWPDPVATLREIRRVLGPAGYAYIDDVHFEADTSITAKLYEVDRHPDYKLRFEEGIKSSPRKRDIERVAREAALPGIRLAFGEARFIIEIDKMSS